MSILSRATESLLVLSLAAGTLGCSRTGLLGPTSDCGPGTVYVEGECLPVGSGGAICGPGTQLVDGECLLADADLSFGSGHAPRDMSLGGPGHGPYDLSYGGSSSPDQGQDGGFPPLPPPVPQGDRAVSWQIDPAHSGGAPGTALRPPLTRLWSYDTGGPIGYPLVSDGRVFVTSGITSGSGSRVTALDSSSGTIDWGPIALGGQYAGVATSAYDVALARLFVMNGDGLVQALDPTNGNALWSRQGYGFAGEIGPLEASSGLLVMPGEWELTVLDGRTGAVRWTGGASATPLVAAITPYAIYSCAVGGYVIANDPQSGAKLWQHQGSGDGGGGCYTVLGGNSVYAYDWADAPVKLDAQSGTLQGGFSGPLAPAFDSNRGYFLIGSNLEAHDLDNDAVLWTFAGDGTLDTQPIAGGGYVYIGGASGMLYAVDGNGQVAYSEQLPSPLTPGSNAWTVAPAGFAIAEDKLFISAGTVLYAYGSGN